MKKRMRIESNKTVISVKEKEIQITGITVVLLVIILLIPSVLLESIHFSRLEALSTLGGISTFVGLLGGGIMSIQINAMSVISIVMIMYSLSVLHLHANLFDTFGVVHSFPVSEVQIMVY